MSDIKFVDGLRIFKPRENAPEFVKGNLLLTKTQLIQWLSSQQNEEIRIDILESKEKGTWYGKVNDFKPQVDPMAEARTAYPTSRNEDEPIRLEDIPF